MSSRVVSLLIAVLCLTSVALAAPLLQPDMGSPTESSVEGDGEGSNMAERIDSALDDAEGEELDEEFDEELEGDGPFDDERYDEEDAERLASDEDPFTPGDGGNVTNVTEGDLEEQLANESSDDTGVLRYGAVQTPYWRVSTFDTYTGTGWERSSDTEPYDPPYEFDGEADRQRYRVTAETSMSIVPTFYQPVAVGGLDEVAARDDGSFERTTPMDAGT